MDIYLGYPLFVWEGLVNFSSLVVGGLIVAFTTTFYLKQRDEKTRVAGVILEKRMESQRDVLRFVDKNTQKIEMLQSDANYIRKLIEEYDLPLPYDSRIQYAEIFSSLDRFREFFHNFEAEVEQHKLWLDRRVRNHLLLMQFYFSTINSLLNSFRQISEEFDLDIKQDDFDLIADRLLLLFGAGIDGEFNNLVMHLEALMIDSMYRLDLTRPRYSFYSKLKKRRERKRIANFLYKESILGEYVRVANTIYIHMLHAYIDVDMSIEEMMDFYMSVASTKGVDKPKTIV